MDAPDTTSDNTETPPSTAWIVEIMHELDQNHIPIQNVERIMRRVLQQTIKIERDAKVLLQECVSEFIGLVTDDAKLFMSAHGRKTVTGPDVVLALEDLWFTSYADLVRRVQWPDTPSNETTTRKKRNRPPPPLESAQQQFACNAMKRWRGGRAPDSATSSGSSGPESADETQQRSITETFCRVLTIHDVKMVCGKMKNHQSSHKGRASTPELPAESPDSTKDEMANETGFAMNQQSLQLQPEDLQEPAMAGQQSGASSQKLISIIGHYVNGIDGLTPGLLPDQAVVLDEPKSSSKLRSVLDSPKLQNFPNSDILRTHHIAVRNTDPFSFGLPSQYGIDLDSLSGNGSVAMDIAFNQFGDNAQASGTDCLGSQASQMQGSCVSAYDSHGDLLNSKQIVSASSDEKRVSFLFKI